MSFMVMVRKLIDIWVTQSIIGAGKVSVYSLKY